MSRNTLGDRSSESRNGGRTERSGPRAARLTLAAGAMLLAAGCGSTSTRPSLAAVTRAAVAPTGVTQSGVAKADPSRVVKGIGTIPSWLPLPSGGAGHQIVAASMKRPVTSASEGDTVRAMVGAAVANITTVGPYVPRWETVARAAGKLPTGVAVPVSYRVTLSGMKGTLGLTRQIFEVALPTGQAEIAAIKPIGAAKVPPTLRAGQRLRLELAVRVPAGNGVVRWAPAGRRALVTWTYQLELD